MTPDDQQQRREFNCLIRELEYQLAEVKMRRKGEFWERVRHEQICHIGKLKGLASVFKPEWGGKK